MIKCTPKMMAEIKTIQENITAAKRATRNARSSAKRLFAMHEEAKDCEGAAEVNTVKAECTVALGALDKVDARGAMAACLCYDEPGPVVFGGGR